MFVRVHPRFLVEIHVAQCFVFCVIVHRSFFVLLTFFIWSLCCLSFDLRPLITYLFFSNLVCHFYYNILLPHYNLYLFVNMWTTLKNYSFVPAKINTSINRTIFVRTVVQVSNNSVEWRTIHLFILGWNVKVRQDRFIIVYMISCRHDICKATMSINIVYLIHL